MAGTSRGARGCSRGMTDLQIAAQIEAASVLTDSEDEDDLEALNGDSLAGWHVGDGV